MTKVVIATLLIACTVCAAASDSLRVTDGFSRIDGFSGRKVIATGLMGGILAVSLVWSYDAWWKNSREPLHFQSENWLNGEHRGIDKAGHFYTSYFYFHTFRNVMLWGGYSPSTAMWWAAGAAAFFALTVEIGDGLSDIGFDYQDLVFNVGGLAYAMTQTEVPFLKNINIKWSYVPSGGYEFPPRFTRHYDAHTYWLTLNVHNLLPASLSTYWPEFLQLAAGYSVDENVTKREAVVGLDFNLGVFCAPNEDIRLLQKTVDMFHVPAPAVKFTEDRKPRYYLFHLN
jgi:hypothetical protein